MSPRRLARLAALLLALALLAPPHVLAQRRGSDYEEFEEVCPYTKDDRELQQRLGYVQVGQIAWRGAHDSESVRLSIGGIPMLFVETANFRIGSSLTTYRVPNDREERARLDKELARLEGKLGGRTRLSRRELDPWLRLHLYAQRVEDLFQGFHEDWDIAEEDYALQGRHLSMKQKHLLLLCERKSEFGRYLSTYEKTEFQHSYRTGWYDEGMLALANFEELAERWKEEKDAPLDSMFGCMIVANVALNLVDGWNKNHFRAPTWIAFGYAHVAQRRFDPRWPVFDGRKIVYGRDEDRTDWLPRVANLVRNDFYARARDMFAWEQYADLDQRDHLVAWSKLTYLLTEAQGDRKAFLTAVCPPADHSAKVDVQKRAALQVEALEQHFGISPEELDQSWSQWVARTSRRR